jgi:hypothetical protein
MKRIAAALLVCLIARAQTPVDSLKANLTYLASDELDGRATPSHGLDLAADFIAKQFRQAGLQPAAPDGSYFQVARFGEVNHNPNHSASHDFSLTLQVGRKKLSISKNEVTVRSFAAIDLHDEHIATLPEDGTIPPIAGLVVAADAARYGSEESLDQLQARKPALILLFGKSPEPQLPQPVGKNAEVGEIGPQLAPVIRIDNTDAARFLNQTDVTVSMHLTPSSQALLWNVAGLLPGSDPVLSRQYVLLTAHYDHLGHDIKGIYHGANDNGSGTVSLIEIARELAALKTPPRRSILFIAFFGEEEGLLGSFYYTHHPLVPLKSTVANINLEQLGRTDDTSGKKLSAFAFTGPSFSTLPAIMADAAKTEGVNVYWRGDGDAFFSRSDNYPFAREGVVDTTIVVAFEYPDYHAVTDTVDKIDFPNMAKVDRAIAAGLEKIADEPDPPKWTAKPRL